MEWVTQKERTMQRAIWIVSDGVDDAGERMMQRAIWIVPDGVGDARGPDDAEGNLDCAGWSG